MDKQAYIADNGMSTFTSNEMNVSIEALSGGAGTKLVPCADKRASDLGEVVLPPQGRSAWPTA